MSFHPLQECNHEHWIVEESNTVGKGSCLDCKKEIPLPVLFNNLMYRMTEAIKKAK